MSREPQRIQVDVSWEALLKVLAFVVAVWLVVVLREVLVMLFGVFIMVAAVNPTVTRWQAYMSRTLAVSLFYSLVVAVFALLVSVFVPTLIAQVNGLVHTLPSVADKARDLFPSASSGDLSVVNRAVDGVRSSLSDLSGSALRTTISFFGGLATVVTGLVISFYLLLEEDNAKDFFHQVLPQHRFEAVYSTVSKISERMGMWVRGQLALMAIIGLANLVAYFIIGIPSPLPLAIWAGLCEAIPYIGPLVGVLPALVVALTTGTIVQAILVLAIGFFLIQQLEAHVVVPKVMGRAVGLSPVLVIIAVAVGLKVFGLLGALISIPVAAIISVVVGEWPSLRKIWETTD